MLEYAAAVGCDEWVRSLELLLFEWALPNLVEIQRVLLLVCQGCTSNGILVSSDGPDPKRRVCAACWDIGVPFTCAMNSPSRNTSFRGFS
jgi:hypothetical protein